MHFVFLYCNLFLQFVGVDDDVQIEAKVWLGQAKFYSIGRQTLIDIPC